MKIEAVTVCVNYGDFLAHTLPVNKKFFDNMVVVTDPKDEKTQQICKYYHVRCVKTDSFYIGDAVMNKGMGINDGLATLDLDDWVVHMDADIVLPPRTRELLHKIDLDPKCIYGIDRLMCTSYEDWIEFLSNPEVQHVQEVFVFGNAFPLGVRIAKTDMDGYVPIGYFQLWNAQETGIKRYPVIHKSVARSDMLHAMQWTRRQRVLIPEIFGIHLESEEAPGGANWRGRQTRRFGREPKIPERG